MEETLIDLFKDDVTLELSGCNKNRNRDRDRDRERDRDGNLLSDLNSAGIPIECRLILDDDITAALYENAKNTMVEEVLENPTIPIPVK